MCNRLASSTGAEKYILYIHGVWKERNWTETPGFTTALDVNRKQLSAYISSSSVKRELLYLRLLPIVALKSYLNLLGTFADSVEQTSA